MAWWFAMPCFTRNLPSLSFHRIVSDAADLIGKGLAGRFAGCLVAGEQSAGEVRLAGRPEKFLHFHVRCLQCRVQTLHGLTGGRDQVGNGLTLLDPALLGQVAAGAGDAVGIVDDGVVIVGAVEAQVS